MIRLKLLTGMSLCLLMASAHAQPAGKKSYVLQGKVEQVNAATKRLTVSHDNVEGWMGGMTMAYALDKAEEVVTRVKVGDQISAKVYEGDYTLYEVQVLGPPSAPKTSSEMSKGGLRLEDLERMALANNPTLKQATAEIAAAAGNFFGRGALASRESAPVKGGQAVWRGRLA